MAVEIEQGPKERRCNQGKREGRIKQSDFTDSEQRPLDLGLVVSDFRYLCREQTDLQEAAARLNLNKGINDPSHGSGLIKRAGLKPGGCRALFIQVTNQLCLCCRREPGVS